MNYLWNMGFFDSKKIREFGYILYALFWEQTTLFYLIFFYFCLVIWIIDLDVSLSIKYNNEIYRYKNDKS